MDTFRPSFPVSLPHQLCPVCMAPHFPFCPPHHASAVHPPQRYDPFYSGQQASHTHHGTFHQHPAAPFGRAPHAVQDFIVGRPTELSSQQSYFPQSNPSHFVEDRRDRGFYGQFQGRAPQLSHPGELNYIYSGSMYLDPRQGGPTGWIEAERDFAYRQQVRQAEMGERPESGERFLSRSCVAELPRVDANGNMPDKRFDRGFRGDYYQTPEDASIERDMAYGMESLTGVAQGRSQYEPLTDAFGDRMHSNNLPAHPNAPQESYESRVAQVFGSRRQEMSIPGAYTVVGDDERNYQSILLQRREEEHTSFTQQGGKREDDLVHRHGFQAETFDRREEMQGEDGMNHAKSLKRKLGQHPLSREEELLIEKGLLDDDLPEPQLHGSFSQQAWQGNVQFISRSKQGSLEEKDSYYQQPGYEASITDAERKAFSTNERGECHHQERNFLISEGQRNKRQEVERERGVPKFPGDWPPEKLVTRQVSWDGPLDNIKPLHIVEHHPHSEGVQTNKDILYTQYKEWEAEDKHMDAVRRAERLAREIQQREEGTYQAGNLQPGHLRKQGMLQESRGHAYHQHQEIFRPEIAEAGSEPHVMHHVSQHDGVSVQQSSHQHQRLYPDRESHFQEAHHQNQHGREAYGRDIQVMESYGGLQSRQQDGLVQFPTTSSQQSQWLKEQSPHRPHLEHSQLVPHHDQQSTSLRLVNSLYPRSVEQELSRARSDRSSSVSLHNQLGLGTAHEVPGGFPPLPSVASINPSPPDSPPPPLPATLPPPTETPPPPPAAATFPSVRQTTTQGLHEYSQRSLPPDGQGLQESHRSVHTGISQSHRLPQFQPQQSQPFEKSKIVDAVNIFRNPGRLTRPDRFVVILRGLPGSGKSYLAKTLRDVEVMNGGSAPRIHSMDDYFTCEVEKEEEVETGSGRSKKKIVKRVMEYCYEPEMEEAYRASMLKAFRKTLEEGLFKFIIVDDRNVLIADFAQFWAIAKRSGYEAFILEAPYSDVKGCTARNVHNFTEQQINFMAERWESTPLLYLKMDVSSLFRADDLNAQDIIEVDMDADDMERDLEDEEEESNQSAQDYRPLLGSERPFTGDRWEDKGDSKKEMASLAKSGRPSTEVGGGSKTQSKSIDNALSGLMTTYGKKDKFVHWSDNQGVKGSSTGFSIGSSQKTASLVIGPGAGYNGISNQPVVGDESTLENTEMRKSKNFSEQLRAEQEAFKAVFARRRQRIRGMDDEDDD